MNMQKEYLLSEESTDVTEDFQKYSVVKLINDTRTTKVYLNNIHLEVGQTLSLNSGKNFITHRSLGKIDKIITVELM
jgi:hypothetical protein